MLIRIISDLHLDINWEYPLVLESNCDYNLIAGDLGGDRFRAEKWLKDNINKGAFISGNHDCYVADNTTLQDVKKFYHEKFPVESDISYLDSDVGSITKELADGTLLVADVLYADYTFRPDMTYSKYPIGKMVEMNMFSARPKMSGSYMNDFMFFARNGKDGPEHLKPEDYLEHFNRTFAEITRIVEENPNRNIILMTHHCLSRRCPSQKYLPKTLYASYVTDKTAWIGKHPNIKVVISGHLHERKVFNVGKAKYIMNPLGYCENCHHKHMNTKTGEEVWWTPDFFLDTEKWKVVSEPWTNDEWRRQEELDHKKFMGYAQFFV